MGGRLLDTKSEEQGIMISSPEQKSADCLRHVPTEGVHDFDVVSEVFITPRNLREPAALAAWEVYPSMVTSRG